jgi:NADH:ubiquinone oxidoreductase subunit 5 (subunit L)/multisubunit Na+/H+ antiporter MnhA subunit
MFGSALTLAALMKALYSVFLGERPADLGEVADVPRSMRMPVLALAALCLLLGVLAFLPVGWIEGAIPGMEGVQWIGWWAPPLATGLLVLSLLAGALVYWVGRKQPAEEGEVFTGGEVFSDEDRIPGTQFYGPLRNLAWLRTASDRIEKGWGDLYVLVDRAGTDFVGVFRRLHTGVLTTYLLWVALGLILLLFALIGG